MGLTSGKTDAGINHVRKGTINRSKQKKRKQYDKK